MNFWERLANKAWSSDYFEAAPQLVGLNLIGELILNFSDCVCLILEL